MKRSIKEEDEEYSLLWGELSWCRGPMIGQGAFGSVYRAELKKPRAFGSVVAVKLADPLKANSLMWETKVLDALQGCPHVIQTFGADTTETTNGVVLYNVLLEFSLGGSLADLIVKSGFHGLSEGVVRKHTKSLLLGLKHIHAHGFVHCDLKPDNHQNVYIYGVQEAFSDVWALGCTVLIMLTGTVPWTTITGSKEYESLMSQIGSGSVPDIPDEISKAAPDFLRCCFGKNLMDRMTADALLDHPFLVGLDETDSYSHVQLSRDLVSPLLYSGLI
ncbi:hypothetical protein FH972_015184 [Carpinus fangiana]|uniref:Protein kinase domain-containing protein n=1 Tax=Carpinus fangiana TaxID=176857 RepID=A0A5N6RFK3_9ROSI|nr:hypothetical protein FH972_015184 [Carpinus fangiana]